MTALAALAHHVPGKTVGQTVLAATFRHPSVLAKEALTLDHLTGGRYILALGAGWHVGEHEAFGIDLPPIGERFDRYEAAIRVIKALFSEAALDRAGVTLDAPPFRLSGATMEPARSGPAGHPCGSAARVRAACGSRHATPTAGTSPRTSTARRRGSSTGATRSCGHARRSGATRRELTISTADHHPGRPGRPADRHGTGDRRSAGMAPRRSS